MYKIAQVQLFWSFLGAGSSFAINLLRKRELGALLILLCGVCALCFFLDVSWVDLRFVIVACHGLITSFLQKKRK